MNKNTVIQYCVISILIATCQSEILTFIGIGSAAGAAYYSYCYFKECCNEDYIPFDTNVLALKMDAGLFGQPLVREVVHALEAQKRNNKNSMGRKALSLSFHGWPGVGKNYVTQMIAESLFKKGLDSKYVKMYFGRYHFNIPKDIHQYQEGLRREIESLVYSCPNALIIFDEVNDIPQKVLDVIKPMLDYHHYKINNVDYSKATFIFISNVGGDEITKKLLELGKPRDKIVLSDFDEVLRKSAYTQEGGFKDSSMIDAHLIDHYVPFLPLEQSHVESCVRTEFQRQGYSYPSTTMVEEAMAVLTYGPRDNPIYANAGCKRIKNQVAYVIQKKHSEH